MQAFRLTERGAALSEIDPPVPRDGEVLVKVTAAGVCRSDLHVVANPPPRYPVPFTLGHEIAGTVAATGPSATGVDIGQPVVVYGPWGCGRCRRCAAGQDNYCDRRDELTWAGAGLGRDGGMAEHVLVPSARHLVHTGDLDPAQVAPLADAGLTPYHAVSHCAGRLGEGSTALVIGVGGLGHVAVRLLLALTEARVYAVDVRESALELAEGAETLLVRADTATVLRSAAGGVDAVFDFVGSDATLDLAAAVLRPAGDLVIVGSGGGRLAITKPGPLPQGAHVWSPFWGTRDDLAEVVRLAGAGRLPVAVERFPLSAASEVFTRLRTGGIRGRAVLVPD
jgi:propanol-preferring alcohol dehydrogenase